MPPRKRAETAPETPALDDETPDEQPSPKRRKSDPEVCPQCFPGGWPSEATAVGCEHGSWKLDA